MLLLLLHRPAAAVRLGPLARPRKADVVQARARRLLALPLPSAAAFNNWLYSSCMKGQQGSEIRSLLVLLATYCSTAARQGSTTS